VLGTADAWHGWHGWQLLRACLASLQLRSALEQVPARQFMPLALAAAAVAAVAPAALPAGAGEALGREARRVAAAGQLHPLAAVQLAVSTLPELGGAAAAPQRGALQVLVRLQLLPVGLLAALLARQLRALAGTTAAAAHSTRQQQRQRMQAQLLLQRLLHMRSDAGGVATVFIPPASDRQRQLPAGSSSSSSGSSTGQQLPAPASRQLSSHSSGSSRQQLPGGAQGHAERAPAAAHVVVLPVLSRALDVRFTGLLCRMLSAQRAGLEQQQQLLPQPQQQQLRSLPVVAASSQRGRPRRSRGGTAVPGPAVTPLPVQLLMARALDLRLVKAVSLAAAKQHERAKGAASSR
jgi:hypothetical protein